MAAASCPPPLPIPPFPFPTIFLAASLSFAAIVFLFLFINRNRKRQQMDHCMQEQEQQQKQQMDVSKWGDFTLTASPLPPPTLVGDERKEGGAGEGEEKKKQDGVAGSDGGDDLGCAERDRVAAAAAAEGGKCGGDNMYPFSSFSSATQRRIKQQYDEIVKSNAAKALTMAQELSIEELASNLSTYKEQLNQVRKLLVDDPGNSEYVDMEKELEEVITLTEELWETAKQTELAGLSNRSDSDASPNQHYASRDSHELITGSFSAVRRHYYVFLVVFRITPGQMQQAMATQNHLEEPSMEVLLCR